MQACACSQDEARLSHWVLGVTQCLITDILYTHSKY
jgi:hypothetical protein